MSFVAGVSSTNDQEIDVLFGTVTPGAENLLGAEKKESKETVDPEKKVIEGEPEVVNHDTDADTLLGGETKEVKISSPKKAEAKSEEKLPENQEVDLKAIYDNMVAQGLWQEVDVPEGTEWNKETFLQVQKLQTTAQYEDLLSRTGTYGKAIIEYENNGGNPKDLLDLFRDQREVQEFDIEDTDSQETFLRSYLEAQGNSQKSIDRTVKALQDQGPEALKEEAEEKKAIWDNQYKQEIEVRKNEQALYSKQLADAQKSFQTTIETALTGDTEVTPKERRDLQSYMLNYSQPFQGRQVSQFYMDMAEVQKDPKNYIELAKFIKGLKTGEYTKKVADKVKKEVAATSFLKIKNNTTIKTTGGGAPSLNDSKTSSFIDYLK